MKNLILKLLFAFVYAIALCADNMSATKLVEARAMLPAMFEKEIEGLVKKSAIIQAFLKFANDSQAKLQGAYQVGRTMKVNMLLAEEMTVNTARTCSPSGNQPSSGEVTVSPFTATARFTISKSQANVNDYSIKEMIARKLYDAERAILFNGSNSLDAKLLAGIVANLSSSNAGNGYDATLNSSIMEVADAQKSAFYSLLNSHMALNNLNAPATLISNTHWEHTFAKASTLGSLTNGVDSASKYGITQFYSNTITNASGYDSTHYLIKDGAMGLVTLQDSLYKNFESASNYLRMLYSSSIIPGLTFMLKQVDGCADTSSNGGQVDDDTMGFELALIGGVYHVLSTNKLVYQYCTQPAGIV